MHDIDSSKFRWQWQMVGTEELLALRLDLQAVADVTMGQGM